MRGKSGNPNLDKLDALAQALKVERNWLLHGMGEVQGEAPIVVDPDEVFVAIPYVTVRPSMGGGHVVESEPSPAAPIISSDRGSRHGLRANPSDLRIMHVEGDSMMPTLHDGDIVLVDIGRRSPTPPASLFCTMAWGWWPSGSSTSPTAIRRASASSRTIRTTSPTKGGEEVNIIGRIRWFAREM